MPVLSNTEIIESVSSVSRNISHIIIMTMDITIPETPPKIIPFLEGSDQEGNFFSTLRYQYAGKKISQILDMMKNIWETDSSAL